ncbi:MAG: FCD domain-containing protein [Homoserinimonas sp.]
MSFDDNNSEDFEQTDRDFHATILRFSDNETLTEGLKRLGLHIQLLRHLANREPDLPEHTMHEREAILAAFDRGETEEAVRMMREHIEGAQQAALGQLSEGAPASA